MSTTEEHFDASSVIFELRELSVRDGLGVREVRPLVLRLEPGRAVEIDLVYAPVAEKTVERAGKLEAVLGELHLFLRGRFRRSALLLGVVRVGVGRFRAVMPGEKKSYDCRSGWQNWSIRPAAYPLWGFCA